MWSGCQLFKPEERKMRLIDCAWELSAFLRETLSLQPGNEEDALLDAFEARFQGLMLRTDNEPGQDVKAMETLEAISIIADCQFQLKKGTAVRNRLWTISKVAEDVKLSVRDGVVRALFSNDRRLNLEAVGTNSYFPYVLVDCGLFGKHLPDINLQLWPEVYSILHTRWLHSLLESLEYAGSVGATHRFLSYLIETLAGMLKQPGAEEAIYMGYSQESIFDDILRPTVRGREQPDIITLFRRAKAYLEDSSELAECEEILERLWRARRLAVMQATHPRLGSKSALYHLPHDLVTRIANIDA